MEDRLVVHPKFDLIKKNKIKKKSYSIRFYTKRSWTVLVLALIDSHVPSSFSSFSSSSWCDPERRPCQEPGALPRDKACACEPRGQQDLGHKVRNVFPPSRHHRRTINVSQLIGADGHRLSHVPRMDCQTNPHPHPQKTNKQKKNFPLPLFT